MAASGPRLNASIRKTQVFGRGFGRFKVDVPVAVAIEDAGVDQFEFAVLQPAPAVLFNQAGIRKFGLRIAVECFHVRVCRSIVNVVVILLDILAVIGLARRETEETFLENRVSSVPERGSRDQQLVTVANTENGVLAPSIRFTASQIMRQKRPGVAARV